MPGEPHRSLGLTALLLIVLVGLAACSTDPAEVEVIDGEIPASLPVDLPFPPESVIGSSRIDRVANQTEVSLQVPGELDDVVRFYTIELVSDGYIVSRSEQEAEGWGISFSRVDLIGTITLSAGSGGTSVVLRVNRS